MNPKKLDKEFCSSRKVSFHFLIMQLTSFFFFFSQFHNYDTFPKQKSKLCFENISNIFQMLHFPPLSIKTFTKFYSNTLSVFIVAKTDFKWIQFKHGKSSWINSKVSHTRILQLENLSDRVSVISKLTIIIGKHKNICQRLLIFILTRMRFWRLRSFWAGVRRIALQKCLMLEFSQRSFFQTY